MNKKYVEIARRGEPTNIQGFLLPRLIFVLSDIRPIKGSVKTSDNLASIRIKPILARLNPNSP